MFAEIKQMNHVINQLLHSKQFEDLIPNHLTINTGFAIGVLYQRGNIYANTVIIVFELDLCI